MNEVKIFFNNSFEININKCNLKKFSSNVFNLNNFFEFNLSIIFVEKAFLRNMKKKYFKKDLFTDIIAFNLNEKNESTDGEIYLSLEIISENARSYGVQLEQEIKRVVCHGILHLIGYNDDTIEKKNEMSLIENESLKLFIDISIIC